MPPKKATSYPQMEDDMDDIRKSLNFLTEEMAKVTAQLAVLTELVTEVKVLKQLIKEKDKTINELEKRIDNLEQYTRMEDIIITGLSVKPRSYTKAAAEGRNVTEDAGTEELFSLERQVLQFLAETNIHVDANNISACHTLPRKDKDKPAIIMRFVNRKSKTEILRQGKKLRGTAVYLNEHLAMKNAEIAREARILRKNNKIKATWTRNSATMVEVGRDKKNPDEFAMALDEALGDFAFPDEFVFDVWGAIGDAKQGRF
ncbi:PDZ domain-containing protein GIPC1 [Anabarilius grahami]|uniref:PDZ domain-containing protein GIPC1 n=1 Tax=Anabarilius grahami TaxID=495550 RepID=A0A3N0Y232_ANAGA|nr:PDZ domain-containing protein GIPC1 [Anabarilius grahami]